MKVFRHIALCALLAIGLMSITSCSKSSTPWGDKFVGAYLGNENCTVGTDNYTVTISATSTPDMTLTLQNIYNNTPAYSATCTKTGDQTFSFSGTQSGTTFTGNGTLSGNQLTITYQISSAAASNACTFVGNK